MKNLKYVSLTVLMISLIIGGFAQFITLNGTFVQYNAYGQLAVGFGLFIWLTHKMLSWREARYSKPITNARDKR